jgi:hypothetical protein
VEYIVVLVTAYFRYLASAPEGALADRSRSSRPVILRILKRVQFCTGQVPLPTEVSTQNRLK